MDFKGDKVVRLSETIAPSFYDIHESIKADGGGDFLLKGGRGSTKSSFAAVEGILFIMRNPDVHGCVFCKQLAVIRSTVFSEYQRAMNRLGVSGYWHCITSPFEIVYKPTGQKIIFKGAFNPEMTKSLAPPFGYNGYLHFEECQNFDGAAELRMIEQTVLRGEKPMLEFKTFNTPRNPNHWINVYAALRKEGQTIHHSYYYDVPTEWLGERFIKDVEHLKETDYPAYEHEYLGVANGLNDNAVFDLVKVSARLDTLEKNGSKPLKTGFVESEGLAFKKDSGGWVKVYKEPVAARSYVIGVDTAGFGSDWCAAQVLDAESGEQAAVLHRRTMDEFELVGQLIGLGNYYNNALVAVETNFSTYVVNTLSERGYHRQYVREREDSYTGKRVETYGFLTTRRSKERIISALVTEFAAKPSILNDRDTLAEMLNFVRGENGKAEAAKGFHDDLVMALAIANEARGQKASFVSDSAFSADVRSWPVKYQIMWRNTPPELRKELYADLKNRGVI